MKYWDIIGNPVGGEYQKLIKLLCDHSDSSYFVTRKELKYDKEVIELFKPFFFETYKTKKWANTETKGPAATVYRMKTGNELCSLLQQSASRLYDWVAPDLPEDLTFIRNGREWFSSTSHEEFAFFTIESDDRRLLDPIGGFLEEND